MQNRKKIEILAPAGTKEAFIAAVEAGADAIYLGGQSFNARLRANNFDLLELEQAVDFAHKRHIKVYVTVNTLYNQKEIPKVIEYIISLYKIGVDAVIIQDLGLGYLVKKIIPSFELHLSTQGSVYDLNGSQKAYDLGYDRVVTARELNIKELEHICQNFQGEIESFVHGAMCISYSGQCQFSRSMGSRSGNRGQCAQPCRLKYTNNEKNLYFLSPSDLQLIEDIDKMIKAKVSSLKIEGRMKSPEYVAKVVSIYRKYVDLYFSNEEFNISTYDKKELMQIFNRGGFSKGFFEGKESKNYMSKEIPKNQGILIGKVVNPKAGLNLVEVDINSNDKLELGDGIEIRGRGFASNVVTYISKKNNKTIIGDIKTKVYSGDKIYKVVSKKQQKESSLYYVNKDWKQGKYIRKIPIDVTVKVLQNKDGYCLSLLGDDRNDTKVIESISIEKNVLKKDNSNWFTRLKTTLNKTGNTPFELGNLVFEDNINEEDFSLQMSTLNSLRRNFYMSLECALVSKNKPTKENLQKVSENQNIVEQENATYLNKLEKVLIDKYFLGNTIEFYFHSMDDYRKCEFSDLELDTLIYNGIKLKIILPIVEIIDCKEEFFEYDFSKKLLEKRGQGLILEFAGAIMPIAKGKEEKYIKKHFDIVKSLMVSNKKTDNDKQENFLTHLYIGNLSWIDFLNKNNIKWFADYGFNIYNFYNAKLFQDLNAKGWCRSLEAETNHSNYPLMTIEHRFEENEIIDRKGEKLEFLRIPNTSKDILRRVDKKSSKHLQKIIESIQREDRENRFLQKGTLSLEFLSGIEFDESGNMENIIYRLYI